MNNNIILSASNISKTYQDGTLYVNALKNMDLDIKEGEILAIVGPSGSGKSTLLHLLGGLDIPTTGTVKIFNNIIINDLPEKQKSIIRNRHFGFIYQFHYLLPEFNALENVCMPLLIRGENKNNAKQQAEILLEKVGLKLRLKHKIGELSGGERQRVAIARALVTKPRCVLADEPTGNLDHNTAYQIYDLIFELNKQLNISFVIVTHDLSWISRASRVFSL